jgi:hypothetical protein
MVPANYFHLILSGINLEKICASYILNKGAELNLVNSILCRSPVSVCPHTALERKFGGGNSRTW